MKKNIPFDILQIQHLNEACCETLKFRQWFLHLFPIYLLRPTKQNKIETITYRQDRSYVLNQKIAGWQNKNEKSTQGTLLTSRRSFASFSTSVSFTLLLSLLFAWNENKFALVFVTASNMQLVSCISSITFQMNSICYAGRLIFLKQLNCFYTNWKLRKTAESIYTTSVSSKQIEFFLRKSRRKLG